MLFCSVGTAFPLSANAAILYGDVNKDESVDSSDILSLDKYQRGMLASNSIDLKNADVDLNAVLDVNDQKTITKSLLGRFSLPHSDSGITFNYSSYTIPSDEKRAYVKYDCSSKTEKNYDLPLPTATYSMVSPFAGSIDDRVLDSSSNAQCIVRLSFKDSDGIEYRGTGFIVGDGVIATCAHCLYDFDNKKFYTDYTIIVYDAKGTKQIAEYSASELHVPEKYYTDKNVYYDYGLIYVYADLSDYGKMSLGLPTDQFRETAQTVFVSGFPTKVQDNSNSNRYIGSGKVTTIAPDSRTIWYTSYADGGDSSGPVFVEYTSGGETFRSAVGIHTYKVGDTDRYGTRMTLPVLRFFCNNPNIG